MITQRQRDAFVLTLDVVVVCLALQTSPLTFTGATIWAVASIMLLEDRDVFERIFIERRYF